MKGRIFLISVLSFLLLSGKVFAASVPNFPSCTNPQGTTLASYADGTHGIAGDSSTHTGSDSVFQLSSTQDMQCFCHNASGIQTNWWKINDMSFAEVNQWEKQGWIYIPDGSQWGLDPAPYLAHNTSFTCPTGTGGGDDNNGGNSNASSVLGIDDPGIKGVLGAMASTGLFTNHLFFTIGTIGIVLLLLSLFLSKKVKKF